MIRLIENVNMSLNYFVYVGSYMEKVEVVLKVFDHFGEEMELQFLK
jgi:hypothetical protein